TLRPQGSQLRPAFSVMQYGPDLIHEVIPGRAVDIPTLIQDFVKRQYLLHDQPRLGFRKAGRTLLPPCAQGRPQTLHILEWLRQAVDVVDTQTVDQAFLVQTQRQCVNGIKGCLFFNSYTDKLVDFKKPAPVDPIGGGAPPGQTIVLALQQLVQTNSAFF